MNLMYHIFILDMIPVKEELQLKNSVYVKAFSMFSYLSGHVHFIPWNLS